MRYLIFLALSFSFSFAIRGQEELDTVVVSEVRLEKGNAVELNKTQTSFTSLGQILSSEGNIYLKNNGPGQVATVSVRGTSSNHFEVIWNGVNINQPTLGQSNLGTLPSGGFNQASLLLGNASVYGASGGFGGGLYLSNNFLGKDEKNQNALALSLGSFWTESLTYQFKGQGLNVYVQHYYSKNDFHFLNVSKPNHPEEKMENASFSGYQAILDLRNPLKKGYVETHLWFQGHFQNLPQSMSAISDPDYHEYQKENHIRWLTGYQLPHRSGFSYYKISGIYDLGSYELRESVFNTNTISHLIQLGNNWKKKNHKLQLGGEYRYESWLENEVGRGRFNAFFIDDYQINPKWQLSTILKLQTAGNLWAPIGRINIRYQIMEPLFFETSISRNTRFPTLNDLYYKPGGNINLYPESGWSMEATLGFSKWLDFSTTYYRQWIENFIQWQPLSGGIWSPENVYQVTIEGLEIEAKKSFLIKKLKGEARLQYSYTNSISHENGIEKTMIYVPRHQGRFMLSFGYKNWQFTYDYLFTGKVFIDRENYGYLPEYHLHNIGLTKQLKAFDIGLQIQNLFNYDYQSVAGRPMPGTQITTTVKWQF